MLGLGQQVDRDHERIGRVVGDDQDLGGPGEQVDAHFAVELPLGLGHVGIPGTGDQVDPFHKLGAERHRGHRLHAAEQVDLVRAGHAHGRHRGGRYLAVDRRCAGDHRGTPATLAVTIVMWAEAVSG